MARYLSVVSVATLLAWAFPTWAAPGMLELIPEDAEMPWSAAASRT
jgi:hypothetical protein